MRAFASLISKGRRPQSEPVPYEEILPMRLKTYVSGKGDKNKDPACLFEMSIVFACLKQNEFVEAACSTEISSFKECYSDFATKKKTMKEDNLRGQVSPGQNKMGYKQLNQILRKYPPLYKGKSNA